jgi:hypothetical protein
VASTLPATHVQNSGTSGTYLLGGGSKLVSVISVAAAARLAAFPKPLLYFRSRWVLLVWLLFATAKSCFFTAGGTTAFFDLLFNPESLLVFQTLLPRLLLLFPGLRLLLWLLGLL